MSPVPTAEDLAERLRPRDRVPCTVDLARKILLHDKVRFLITVAGVGFAVTLVFVQVGLFLGLLQNASVTIDNLDAWLTTVVARVCLNMLRTRQTRREESLDEQPIDPP